jgi:hypothetical protein
MNTSLKINKRKRVSDFDEMGKIKKRQQNLSTFFKKKQRLKN